MGPTLTAAREASRRRAPLLANTGADVKGNWMRESDVVGDYQGALARAAKDEIAGKGPVGS